MDNNVAIIGAGAIELANVVKLSSLGFKVNLFELSRFKSNIQPIIEKGGVEFSGVTGTINTMIHIFSVIDGIDYMKEENNIEKMGISGLNKKEILKLLENGF
jgi:hypothetical protein